MPDAPPVMIALTPLISIPEDYADGRLTTHFADIAPHSKSGASPPR